jgi:hypothetical protein
MPGIYAGLFVAWGITVTHRRYSREHQLLAQVDRRLRSHAWMTMSTVIAAVGVMAAAIRL